MIVVWQSSIYALLTALASSQEGAEQFSVRVLDGIFKAFLSAFSKGAFVKIKLLLRFMVSELLSHGFIYMLLGFFQMIILTNASRCSSGGVV